MQQLRHLKYWLTSRLLFPSQLNVHVVKSCATDYPSSNHAFNIFQFAFTQSHSIEIILLAVRDHIRRFACQQKDILLIFLLFSIISTLSSCSCYHQNN